MMEPGACYGTSASRVWRHGLPQEKRVKNATKQKVSFHAVVVMFHRRQHGSLAVCILVSPPSQKAWFLALAGNAETLACGYSGGCQVAGGLIGCGALTLQPARNAPVSAERSRRPLVALVRMECRPCKPLAFSLLSPPPLSRLGGVYSFPLLLVVPHTARGLPLDPRPGRPGCSLVQDSCSPRRSREYLTG